MARQDLIKTTASYVNPTNGQTVAIPGEFRSFSGGGLTSADIKTTPNAGGKQLARGGRQTVENVTIAREDDGTLDLKALAGLRGRARFSVTRTPLDDTLNPRTAAAITYSGVLLRVTPGPGDTASDTNLDEFEIEISCDSVVS